MSCILEEGFGRQRMGGKAIKQSEKYRTRNMLGSGGEERGSNVWREVDLGDIKGEQLLLFVFAQLVMWILTYRGIMNH